MFLHLGGEIIVPLKDVVAIMDVKTRNNSESTAEFLTVAEEEGFVVHLGGKVHSFVVTTDKVFLSPISTATLRKRAIEGGLQWTAASG